MTIIVPPDLELALAEAARREGTTPELFALNCLRERFLSPPHPSATAAGTLADFLAEHIGMLDSGEDREDGASLSEEIGSRFTAGFRTRRTQERL